MLADRLTPTPTPLEIPSTPTSPRFDAPPSPFSINSSPSGTLRSVNYVPSKFSSSVLLSTGSPRRRKTQVGPPLPKIGGGVEAFKEGEARMPNKDDEDYDGVLTNGWSGSKKKLRWTKFKWILFVCNTVLTAYSIVALVVCLLIWFNFFQHSDIVRAGNRTELIISTLAASLGVMTSIIGWAGILLNNRCFLAIYTFLLWIVFALLVTPGYLTYRRRTFNLEGKVNSQWSRQLGTSGRLRIQNELYCCGFFSPYVEAALSPACYSRSVLPGCKLPYMEFQRVILQRWFTCVFSVVPAHVLIMVATLLCSNHVTYRFGKGMMPKAYRLDMQSVVVIMDNYANELAEKYGNDVASDFLKHSRSNLQLNEMSTMPYSPSFSGQKRPSSGKYESISGRAPESVVELQ
ncbi:hypothetical protein AMATHDRAFT_155837 [Amanita thiersii Skay4041]|uniref:Tetraspanin Tsp2 family n=1 Tax=Amanita thiersii Skay4041 TaxID=703135 RepID=A0A2A9NEU7_9AGAR|nr:hypothetical protein AMATHDRAFT_155837 [Amanita thiersii Skay4041]